MGTMVTNSLKWCEITLNSILHFKAPFDDFGNQINHTYSTYDLEIMSTQTYYHRIQLF